MRRPRRRLDPGVRDQVRRRGVHRQLPGFATKLSFDPANPAAGSLDVVIPLAGAKSGNSDRDSTLQGADFFNVGKFATARYTAKGFRAVGNDQFAADGTLELRGVSKPVTLTFTGSRAPSRC